MAIPARVQDRLRADGSARVACVLHPDLVGPEPAASPTATEVRKLFWGGEHDTLWLPFLGVVVGRVEPEGAAALDGHGAVKQVHPVDGGFHAPDPARRKPVSADDAKATPHRTWGLTAIRAQHAWEKHGLTGRGVDIAHLDLGVDAAHPALEGKIASFFGFDKAGRAVPRKPSYTGEHGTHTAGTLLGSPVGGLAIGLAPDARLHSALIDVTAEDGGVEQMLAATDAMLGLRKAGAPIALMSVSLAGQADPPNVFDHWALSLRASGVLPVAAIGNIAGTGETPGNCCHVLGVGALARDREVYSVSGSGTYDVGRRTWAKPDVVAPGEDVWSAWAGHDGGSQELMSDSGTSMATPHAAGVAALVFEARPEATPDQVEQAIVESCRPVEGASADAKRQGHGLIDAGAAVDRLIEMLPSARGAAATKRPVTAESDGTRPVGQEGAGGHQPETSAS